MIISSSFSYLFFHWRCFVVSTFRYSASALSQCSTVPRCFDCSGGVPLFRQCSVVPWVFRCSGGVTPFCGCSEFRCSGGVPLFRRSAGVPCSVVSCSGVPGFIVCRQILRLYIYNYKYNFGNIFTARSQEGQVEVTVKKKQGVRIFGQNFWLDCLSVFKYFDGTIMSTSFVPSWAVLRFVFCLNLNEALLLL